MEYYIIIASSLIIVLSYLFNRLSSRSNIPSVLMLIILGIVCRELVSWIGVDKNVILQLFGEIKLLEILGTLGLILIVLEAALELKISNDRFALISKSFLSAFFGLLLCLFAIASIFSFAFEEMSWIQCLIYSTPLSIISSAIVIPSVVRLEEEREEFHIYESTFSDILGIMFFYLLTSIAESKNNAVAIGDFTIGLVLTVVVSILLSYLLIYVFQSLETKIKLFLMIAVLFLLFSVGKLMHLSSLLIILVFGVVLNNYKLFFSGPLKKHIRPLALENIKETFLLITIESAFVVRTFFFVIFGFSIAIISVLDTQVVWVSIASLLIIYITRFLPLFVLDRKHTRLAITIAPRGLITLLLFYSIPKNLIAPNFNSGVLLFVIITSSLVMAYGLIKNGQSSVQEVE